MSAAGPTSVELAARLLMDMEAVSHVENTAAAIAMNCARTVLTGQDERGTPQPVDCARAVMLLREVELLTTPALRGQARKGSAGAERMRLLHTAQIALHLLKDVHMVAVNDMPKVNAFGDVQPLASMDETAVSDLLRLHGMHAPREEFRQGCDAFTIRSDVSVFDACETLARRLRELRALLSLMACDQGADPRTQGAAEACLTLAEEASGLHALVVNGVLEHGKA